MISKSHKVAYEYVVCHRVGNDISHDGLVNLDNAAMATENIISLIVGNSFINFYIVCTLLWNKLIYRAFLEYLWAGTK